MKMSDANAAWNMLSAQGQGVLANTVLCGQASLMDRVIKEINRLYNINLSHNEELFYYELINGQLQVGLGVGTQAIGYIQIEDNLDFVACNWSALAWQDGLPNAGGVSFTVTVKNMSTGRYFHSSHPNITPIHGDFIGSVGAPTWFPQPMVLTKGTVLECTFTNSLAQTAMIVRLQLHGFKVFTYDSVNWGVRR